MSKENSIKILLDKRRKAGNLRSLSLTEQQLIDFSSNDYLGLARSEDLKRRITQAYLNQSSKNGSTGSRLLTGNSHLVIETESFLTNHFGFDNSLLFSSGYMANMAFFSAVPQKGDTIIYDELAHACIKDGMRLSFAKRMPFKHNSIEDLKLKLAQAEGSVYVACESVYSMDGDMAPLKEFAKICQEYQANLIVDEAHSTGIWGINGQGLVHELNLQEEVFAVVHTFGKAMGIHGASISGNNELKDFLINYSRPFIYTTAPSDFEIISIQTAFDYLAQQPNRQANLFHKINIFDKTLENESPSAIKTIQIGGNTKTKRIALQLQEAGFDVRPILSPTVKEGSERLRICIHTYNTEEEIISLAHQIKKMLS